MCPRLVGTGATGTISTMSTRLGESKLLAWWWAGILCTRRSAALLNVVEAAAGPAAVPAGDRLSSVL